MRSRSCYAIAASSFLLLWTACLGQGAKSDGDDAKAVSAKADEKKEDRKEDHKVDLLEAAETGDMAGDSGEPIPEDDETGDEGGEGAAEPGPTTGRKHACEPGMMPFEGRCTSKDRVTEILEERERDALKRVQMAQKPDQTADAVHDLLEQQIVQMDKAEDDLDEIIEQLRRENAEKEGKGGAPPKDGKEDPG